MSTSAAHLGNSVRQFRTTRKSSLDRIVGMTNRWPAMSHDGLQIAYQSLASDLLCDKKCKAGQADINLQWDVFVHNRGTGNTIRASRGSGGDWMEYSRAPSLDASGGMLLFVTRHPIDDGDDGYDEDLVVQTHALGKRHGATSGDSTDDRNSRPTHGARRGRQSAAGRPAM